MKKTFISLIIILLLVAISATAVSATVDLTNTPSGITMQNMNTHFMTEQEFSSYIEQQNLKESEMLLQEKQDIIDGTVLVKQAAPLTSKEQEYFDKLAEEINQPTDEKVQRVIDNINKVIEILNNKFGFSFASTDSLENEKALMQACIETATSDKLTDDEQFLIVNYILMFRLSVENDEKLCKQIEVITKEKSDVVQKINDYYLQHPEYVL